MTYNTPSDSRRVLDLGCAVGGASFALTKTFKEVVGIDFSQHFIDAANLLKIKKTLPYEIQKQGKNYESRVATLEADVDVTRVNFIQGDACNLDVSDIGTFDCIHASNLLCRLPSPRSLF